MRIMCSFLKAYQPAIGRWSSVVGRWPKSKAFTAEDAEYAENTEVIPSDSSDLHLPATSN
jgi:hypothetical protein